MKFIPVKTRIVFPPKDEIWDILDILNLQDGDIVFITSKILAIHQGRCVKVEGTDKQALINNESTHVLPLDNKAGYIGSLTIADNILIPNAGIDESNADGHYILYPEKTDNLCREIRVRLLKKNNIKNLGIISTDSHITPLRWGVTGITTGLAGIKPLKDLRNVPDIFGRKMVVAQVNIADALAGMAVLLMGEANEQVPIVILRGYKDVEFCENASMKDFNILPEEDLFQPLLSVLQKIK